MSTRYVLRCASVVLCFVLGACGSKPVPTENLSRAPVPGPETAASRVQSPAAAPRADSVPTKAPVDQSRSPKQETLPDVVRKTFPTAGSARSVSKPFPHRVISDSSGRVLGFEVFSDSAGVTGRGYAGMVPVQVLLDAQAKPVRIYVLDNCETPAYLDIAVGGGLLERLLAYDPARPESVDAVTLATSSSKAIIAGVTGLAARVSAEVVAKGQRRE
jgi:hypothetical protein